MQACRIDFPSFLVEMTYFIIANNHPKGRPITMKNFLLLFVHIACATGLFLGACSNEGQSKLKGEWESKDAGIRLKITGNKFTEDTGTKPVAEDYFMKGDTIFTSFEGNMPYTKFVIQQLDEHTLKLLYPDSVSITFSRR